MSTGRIASQIKQEKVQRGFIEYRYAELEEKTELSLPFSYKMHYDKSKQTFRIYDQEKKSAFEHHGSTLTYFGVSKLGLGIAVFFNLYCVINLKDRNFEIELLSNPYSYLQLLSDDKYIIYESEKQFTHPPKFPTRIQEHSTINVVSFSAPTHVARCRIIRDEDHYLGPIINAGLLDKDKLVIQYPNQIKLFNIDGENIHEIGTTYRSSTSRKSIDIGLVNQRLYIAGELPRIDPQLWNNDPSPTSNHCVYQSKDGEIFCAALDENKIIEPSAILEKLDTLPLPSPKKYPLELLRLTTTFHDPLDPEYLSLSLPPFLMWRKPEIRSAPPEEKKQLTT